MQLPARCPPQCAPPPPATDPQVLRRGGELCPLEAMLMGSGELELWAMDHWTRPHCRRRGSCLCRPKMSWERSWGRWKW